MARLKRNSVILNKAMLRRAGMRSIHETLEFGDGLSLAEYDIRIQALQTQLSTYNTMLSTLDEMAGRIGLMEQDLRSYSEKMLMSVATRYGKDSLQYMQAGGKARKRLTRSTSSLTASPAMTPMETANPTTNGNGASVMVN